MKKMLTLMLVGLLVLSMCPAALAKNTTTVTTTVPEATYTLNIPADQKIDFGAGSPELGTLKVTDSSGFAAGKDLEVTISYTDFTSDTTSTSIPFTVTMPNSGTTVTISSGGKIRFTGHGNGTVDEYARANDERQSVLQNICLSISSTDWGKALAGDYTATITFTAKVVSSAS